MSRVASIVSEAIAAQGCTQAEVARWMGFTPQYVTDILKGKKRMTTQTALLIGTALGVDPLDFLKVELLDLRERQQGRLESILVRKQQLPEEQRLRRELEHRASQAKRKGRHVRDMSLEELRQLDRLLTKPEQGQGQGER